MLSTIDIQLQLTSGSNTYTAEFATGPAMQDFMSVLTSMYNSENIFLILFFFFDNVWFISTNI